MDRRLKLLTAFCFALFAFAFLVLRPLLWAESVDEKIEALERELAELQAAQVEMGVEMGKEAVAARDALPVFVYRPGRGLSIRGADRSWDVRIGGQVDSRTSFFPDNDAEATAASGGPSQFAMKIRRLRMSFDFSWDDGLYSAGFTPVWERSPSAGFLGGGLTVGFSKFSPYYPDLKIISIRPNFNNLGITAPSLTSPLLEYPAIEGSLFPAAASEGWGFRWTNVPLGAGRIRSFDVAAIAGLQFDSKTDVSPIDQKGLLTALVIAPFADLKSPWIQGLELGISYVNERVDDPAAGCRANPVARNCSHAIGTQAPEANEPMIFGVTAKGERWWVLPNLRWNFGPYRFGASYSRIKSERDFRSPGRLDDIELRELLFTNELFIWGPKGFLSGNERTSGSWKLGYHFLRDDFDAGRDFASAVGDAGNAFSAMRRYHFYRNTVSLMWIMRANIVATVEYNIWEFSAMRGAGSAATARQRLGIGSGGGTAQDITLGLAARF